MIGRPNNEQNNSELIFLTSVGPKKATDFRGKDKVPYFEVTKKTDEGWKVVAKDDQFSGNLRSISAHDKWNPNNEKEAALIKQYKNSRIIKLTFDDPASGETYVWKVGFGVASRGLFNCILNLTSGKNLTVKLWKTKEGDYEKYSLYQGTSTETVKWKYQKEDLPAIEEVVFDGETLKNYTPINKFLEDKLVAFKFGESEVEDSEPVSNNHEEDHEEVSDETEIPF